MFVSYKKDSAWTQVMKGCFKNIGALTQLNVTKKVLLTLQSRTDNYDDAYCITKKKTG